MLEYKDKSIIICLQSSYDKLKYANANDWNLATISTHYANIIIRAAD